MIQDKVFIAAIDRKVPRNHYIIVVLYLKDIVSIDLFKVCNDWAGGIQGIFRPYLKGNIIGDAIDPNISPSSYFENVSPCCILHLKNGGISQLISHIQVDKREGLIDAHFFFESNPSIIRYDHISLTIRIGGEADPGTSHDFP